MSILIAAQLLAANGANAPRTIPLPTVENVTEAQPQGYSGNIIINGVCLDITDVVVEIRDLNCQRTARFDEFACSYNVLWDDGIRQTAPEWQQRTDIIFQNQEGKWLRDRELMPPKSWVKGRWK
jgi:hypothetical protein